jgi:hypothetical protein
MGTLNINLCGVSLLVVDVAAIVYLLSVETR